MTESDRERNQIMMQSLKERRELKSWRVIDRRVRHRHYRRRLIEDNQPAYQPRRLPGFFRAIHEYSNLLAILVMIALFIAWIWV